MSNNINPKTGKPKYYKDNPAAVKKRAERDMYVNGNYISKYHPLYKPGKFYIDNWFNGDVALAEDKTKEGYVYIISSGAAEHKGWVKIGMADDPDKRLGQYQTSSPFRDYTLHYAVYCVDKRLSESIAHEQAMLVGREGTHSLFQKSEWFKISVQQAITILDNLNEYGHVRPTKKADTHKEEDNIQGSLF